MISSPEFKKYPCHSRDDVFDILLSLGLSRNVAYETSELVRKGLASREKYADKFESLNLPEDLYDMFKNIRYLFPRAHCCEFLLTYSILAYYLKIDSKNFSKVIRPLL
jgi:DNA polymerase-3 subunit alpha (Gram-positive type)